MDTVFLWFYRQGIRNRFRSFRPLSACGKQKYRNFAENLIEYNNNKINKPKKK